MKIFTILFCCTFISTSVAFSLSPSDNEGMTKAEFIAQAQTEKPLDVLDFDINDDKKISYNELQEMISGFKVPFLKMSDDQQKEIKDTLNDKFKQNDKNNDGYLDATEYPDLENALITLLVSYRFDEMDRNRDGIFNFEDIPPMEESLQKIQTATEKLKETTQKLEETSSDEMAANLFNSFSVSLAKEEFFGMDKDRDNCVTKDEYVTYSLQQQDQDNEDDRYKLSREDFIRLYAMIKKKAPDCLTQEDYMADSQKNINDILEKANTESYSDTDIDFTDSTTDNPDFSKEFAQIIFLEMDTNNDGKVTQDEYVAYEKANGSSSPELNHADLFRFTFGLNDENKNWVNKEEFIASMIKVLE